MDVSLYLAGPLFTVAERMHNSRMEQLLIETAKGRGIALEVTSPQRTALRRFISPEKGFDVQGIVSDCVQDSANHDIILCNLDGTDVDSGTAVEYGIALGQQVAYEKTQIDEITTPKIITYRTDFRTAPDREIGVNAMLIAKGTTHIYFPCFGVVEEGEIQTFYEELASRIVEEIK